MGSHYNQKARKITSDDISSITLFNTTMTKNWDVDGGFVFEGYHTTTGCGTAQDTSFLILLKDNINWTKMCFKWEGSGNAACWSFDQNGTGGNGVAGGNLIAYSEAAGDRLHDNYLTWEVPAYQTHTRTAACDNQADNFFRFNNPLFKRFRITRRRNVNGSLGGIQHGRSCNSAGVTSISRISDIFIW